LSPNQQQRGKVGVGGDHNPVVGYGPVKDLAVGGCLHVDVRNVEGVVARRSQRPRDDRRKRYRPETSTSGGDGGLALAHGFGREVKGFPDVLRLEIGIGAQDLLIALARRHHSHNGSDGNPQSPDTRDSAHLIVPQGDSLKGHRHLRAWCFASHRTLRKPTSGLEPLTPSLRVIGGSSVPARK
jgi:hypothetical protein